MHKIIFVKVKLTADGTIKCETTHGQMYIISVHTNTHTHVNVYIFLLILGVCPLEILHKEEN